MKSAGCVAVSDDGHPVQNARVMRRALEYARTFGLPVIDHCEDLDLSKGGAMNEGAISVAMGIPSAPHVSETIMVERDVLLAEFAARASTSPTSAPRARWTRSAAARRGASAGHRRGDPPSPHPDRRSGARAHNYNPVTKMNPPLRSEEDRQAVIAGLLDGTIDAIATDHAPHTTEEKVCEFDCAAFGIVGLETAFALCHDRLVKSGVLDLTRLVQPHRGARALLGLPGGTLEKGRPADLTIFDPAEVRTVKPESFRGKSRNSPFVSMTLTGWPVATIVHGRVVFRAK